MSAGSNRRDLTTDGIMAERRRNRAGHAQLRRRGGFHKPVGYQRDRGKPWKNER